MAANGWNSAAHKAVLLAAVTASAASSARAEDVFPPPWRGEPGTTFQHWSFPSDQGGPPDVSVDNPHGTPQLTVSAPNGAWLSASGGRSGVWSLAGSYTDTLRFTVPLEDPPPAGARVEVHVQFAFRSINGANLWVGYELSPTAWGTTPLGDGWTLVHFVLEAPACPTQTLIEVGTDAEPSESVEVDDMLIDTLCVTVAEPVPATSLGGLSLQGLALLIGTVAVFKARWGCAG